MTVAHEEQSRSAPRILIVADLHLDQWKHAGLDPLDHLSPAEWASLDGLILAGDLSNAAMRKWPRFLARLCQKIAPERIHVIPGNHDYYDMSVSEDDTLSGLCRDHGIDFAQTAEVRIGDERFLCATLWTDFRLPADPALMDDFRRISAPGGGVLRPADLADIHQRQLEWLDARLATGGHSTTVVTHHLPHPSLVPPDYSHPGGFASDLGWLLRRHQPREWLFGHAHGAPDLVIENVPCRNVALGPPCFRGPDASQRLRDLIR